MGDRKAHEDIRAAVMCRDQTRCVAAHSCFVLDIAVRLGNCLVDLVDC